MSASKETQEKSEKRKQSKMQIIFFIYLLAKISIKTSHSILYAAGGWASAPQLRYRGQPRHHL